MTSINIDGAPVPLEDIYGEEGTIAVRPIGRVVKHDRAPLHPDAALAEIHLFPGMRRFMSGLKDETGLTVVWYCDQARSVRTRFPRGWDGKEVGPFASRTPHRLTPIAVTDVELVEVRGTVLVVRGLDAFDGTPVLDLKVSLASLKARGARARKIGA